MCLLCISPYSLTAAASWYILHATCDCFACRRLEQIRTHSRKSRSYCKWSPGCELRYQGHWPSLRDGFTFRYAKVCCISCQGMLEDVSWSVDR